MLTCTPLTWLLLTMCADFWMNTVTGSLVLEMNLNVSAATPRQNKIFFSRHSEDASFKLVLDNEEMTVKAENVEGWQELRFVSSAGPDCTSALTQKYRYGHHIMEICSYNTENQLVIRVVDVVNISLAIGDDPNKLFGDAKNAPGKLQTDVAACIAAVLILGLLCYSVYLIHDTRKMIKDQNECDHAASLCTLQNESKMTPERKFSTTSVHSLTIPRNSSIRERKTSVVSIGQKPNSPKPPTDLPPPVPPTPDKLNNLAVSPEKLDSDSSSPPVREQITEEEEEEHDYDYIDLRKLQQYKDQMKLVGQEIEERFIGQRLSHDSENSVYEPFKSSELSKFENTGSGNSLYESLINLEIAEHFVQQDEERRSTPCKQNSDAPKQEISLDIENEDTLSEAVPSPVTHNHEMLPQDSMRPENERPTDVLSTANLCQHQSTVTLIENELNNSLEDFTHNFQSLEELPLEAQSHANEAGKEGSNEALIPVIQSQNNPEQGHKWDSSDESFSENLSLRQTTHW